MKKTDWQVLFLIFFNISNFVMNWKTATFAGGKSGFSYSFEYNSTMMQNNLN